MKPSPSIELEAGDIDQLLQSFTNEAKHAVEASADGLVTVRMGPTFTALSIELHDTSLNTDQKQRLEAATLAAVNAAIRKVSLSAGQVLIDFRARKQADRPKEGKSRP